MPAVDRVAVPVANAREEGLRAREVRDMPDPPRNYWRLVGPGIVAGGFLHHAKVDPDLDPLREDPRFKAMMAAAEERLAAGGDRGSTQVLTS